MDEIKFEIVKTRVTAKTRKLKATWSLDTDGIPYPQPVAMKHTSPIPKQLTDGWSWGKPIHSVSYVGRVFFENVGIAPREFVTDKKGHVLISDELYVIMKLQGAFDHDANAAAHSSDIVC